MALLLGIRLLAHVHGLACLDLEFGVGLGRLREAVELHP